MSMAREAFWMLLLSGALMAGAGWLAWPDAADEQQRGAVYFLLGSGAVMMIGAFPVRRWVRSWED